MKTNKRGIEIKKDKRRGRMKNEWEANKREMRSGGTI
jgi:hypothetical protein